MTRTSFSRQTSLVFLSSVKRRFVVTRKGRVMRCIADVPKMNFEIIDDRFPLAPDVTSICVSMEFAIGTNKSSKTKKAIIGHDMSLSTSLASRKRNFYNASDHRERMSKYAPQLFIYGRIVCGLCYCSYHTRHIKHKSFAIR